MSRPIWVKTPNQYKQLRAYAVSQGLPETIYEEFEVFANYMVPSWGTDRLPWEWFHKYMATSMGDLCKGDLDVLTLETHSQIGKSVLVSLWIIYCFGLNPNIAVMYFTYNEVAAVKFTKQYVLSFMGSDKFRKVFPYVALKNAIDKQDFSEKMLMKKKVSTFKDNEFNIVNPLNEVNHDYRGSFIALGISQGSHGRPADLMIVDDYVNKAESVKSEVYREMLKTVVENDIIMRFQASTKFAIICTRWYNDDPIGIIQNKMENHVIPTFIEMGIKPPTMKCIKIRAQYRTSDDNPPEDPRTTDGEWLWKPMMAKYLLAVGSKYFNATFNCDPNADGDEDHLSLKDFGTYETLPSWGGRVIYSIDPAATDSETSNHTSIGEWLVYGRKRYLIKLWYFKRKIPEMQRMVEAILSSKPYNECLIEFTSGGQSLCQYLEERRFRFKALSYAGKVLNSKVKKELDYKQNTTKSHSKWDRYLQMLPEVTAEVRIFLPKNGCQYLDVFVKQLTTYRGELSTEDDMVDMTTMLVNYTKNNVIIASSGNFKTKPVNNNLEFDNAMCYNIENGNYFNNLE